LYWFLVANLVQMLYSNDIAPSGTCFYMEVSSGAILIFSIRLLFCSALSPHRHIYQLDICKVLP